MTTDYQKLRADNELEYGRAIGRIGKMLLEDRYDKRTHFIFEILQNAEDALRRRGKWSGSRSVRFDLSRQALRISHFGAPFNGDDVRGVCGINESTKKDHTAIGRFGIGFKSVYAFTSRPEVHSGDEAFVIQDYVLPSPAAMIERDAEETVILLPLASSDHSAFEEIAEGLQTLGSQSLLFLRHVDEVLWSIADGGQGGYKREEVNSDGFMRQVRLTASGEAAEESTFLLFSRPVSNECREVGFVEAAFLVMEDEKRQRPSVQRIADARLVVHFPTVLPTHTGFLIQGPYQTTPSRDNIPSDKPWNKYLVAETGELLVDILCFLRDRKMLDISTLRSLPLERQKLTGTLFAPLYDRLVSALKTQRLLPQSNGQYGVAAQLRIARAQDVRDLFGPKQLGQLLGEGDSIHWVIAEITADRTPELRTYLMQELKIPEIVLESMLGRLTKTFLEEQSDAWILRLYGLLSTQPALMRGKAKDLPLIRLEDGTHVQLVQHGLVQAFLPIDGKTGFPTVRSALCTGETLRFLKNLGLTTPDPVDDVIRNLLPAYRLEQIEIDSYEDDIARMLRAFQTDSSAQREKLIEALRTSSIVMAKDAGTGLEYMAVPADVYLASTRMLNLFAGIESVSVIDNSYSILRGEKIREMLEACGATRILRTESVDCTLSNSSRSEARRAAGFESASYELEIRDKQIVGLDALLSALPRMSIEDRRERAALLWEALAEFVDRRGASALTVAYSWFYHSQRTTQVDAHFVRQLNDTAWIPDDSGELRRPAETFFSQLGWPESPILESKVRFKPPAIAELAREVGIDPDVLDELKRIGVTHLEQLRACLKLDQKVDDDDDSDHEDTDDEEERSGSGETEPNSGGSQAHSKEDLSEDQSTQGNSGVSSGRGENHTGGQSGGKSRNGGATGTREFISYVGARAPGDDQDPDGLSQVERMKLEEQAIARILRVEPTLQRTKAGNEGFDLMECDLDGEPERWIEVKAMAGALVDRPVGLSPAQMEYARRYADQFWLYVVEYAADNGRARILRIRNPHGATGTFTFDRGWEAVADIVKCAGDLSTAAE